VLFRNMLPFQGEELLALRPIGKQDEHPLSSVRGCLFDIYTRHTRRQRIRHVVMTGSTLPQRSDYEICDMDIFKRIITVHNVVIWSRALTLRSATRVLRSWVRVPLGEILVAASFCLRCTV